MRHALLAFALLAATAHAGTVRLAWDPSPTPGCTYVLYAEQGTNSVRVDVGDRLAVDLEDLPAGVWSFWATAERGGVESDPSGVVTVEVPRQPEGMRTVAIDYGPTITNLGDTAFFRLRIP